MSSFKLSDDAWVLSPSSREANTEVVLMDESKVANCMECTALFSIIMRKHHCKTCGKVFCGKCCRTVIVLINKEHIKQRKCSNCLITKSELKLKLIKSTSDKIEYSNENDENNENNSTIMNSSSILKILFYSLLF
jgi:hypothetical protein